MEKTGPEQASTGASHASGQVTKKRRRGRRDRTDIDFGRADAAAPTPTDVAAPMDTGRQHVERDRATTMRAWQPAHPRFGRPSRIAAPLAGDTDRRAHGPVAGALESQTAHSPIQPPFCVDEQPPTPCTTADAVVQMVDTGASDFTTRKLVAGAESCTSNRGGSDGSSVSERGTDNDENTSKANDENKNENKNKNKNENTNADKNKGEGEVENKTKNKNGNKDTHKDKDKDKDKGKDKNEYKNEKEKNKNGNKGMNTKGPFVAQNVINGRSTEDGGENLVAPKNNNDGINNHGQTMTTESGDVAFATGAHRGVAEGIDDLTFDRDGLVGGEEGGGEQHEQRRENDSLHGD